MRRSSTPLHQGQQQPASSGGLATKARVKPEQEQSGSSDRLGDEDDGIDRLDYSGSAVVGWAVVIILVVTVTTWAVFTAAYAEQTAARERACQSALIEAQAEVVRCHDAAVLQAITSHSRARAAAAPTVTATATNVPSPPLLLASPSSTSCPSLPHIGNPSSCCSPYGPDVGFRPRWRGSLGFFPNRTAWEPYQAGLYARAEEHGLDLMSKHRMWNLTIGYERADHRKHFRYVFHLHWVAMVCTKGTQDDGFKELQSVLDFFQRIEEQGWYIVWTVHDVIDPSCTPEQRGLQVQLLQTLADRADIIHLLCPQTLTLTAPYYRIPPEKVITVPQGSYVGLYSDVNLTQVLARRTLSVHTPFASDGDDLVLLYIGTVKRHRGLARLVQAFNRVSSGMNRTQLWVVGEVSTVDRLKYSDAQWQQIEAAINVNPAIKTQYGRVHDDDLQFYYKAADVVVLPYPRDSVLSSGTLLTAFTFGRPVIAPPLSCLAEWLTDDVSIIFEPEDEDVVPSPTTPPGIRLPSQDGERNSTAAPTINQKRSTISLEEALRQAGRLRAESFRAAAHAKAQRYTYRDMSRLFFEKLKWRL